MNFGRLLYILRKEVEATNHHETCAKLDLNMNDTVDGSEMTVKQSSIWQTSHLGTRIFVDPTSLCQFSEASTIS